MDTTPPISLRKLGLIFPALAVGVCLSSKTDAMEGATVDGADVAGRAVVLIENGRNLKCSGVAFRKDDILTAAHCVVDDENRPTNPKFIRVYYEGRDASRSVRRVIVHDEFELGAKIGRLRKANPASSDLAILKMSERHPSSSTSAVVLPRVIPALLGPSLFKDQSLQKFGVAYGFGSARPNDPPVLRYGQMMIESPKSKLDKIDGRSRLSGLSKKNMHTALCHGDSGGPVFVRAKKTGRAATMRGGPILAGLIISASGQFACSKDSRMIDLGVFHDWLLRH